MEYDINFKCPSCGAEAKLELEAKSNMVVFPCFKCNAALMHYYDETYEIDPSGLEFLSKKPNIKTTEVNVKINNLDKSSFSVSSEIHHIGEPVRDSVISEDDIVDLMIALQTNSNLEKYFE